MAILGDLPVTAIGQTADGFGQKLPAPRAFAFTLLDFGGNADGSEFLAVAVEPAGEAQAQGAGIELVGLALAVQGDGRDEKTLGARRQQFAMEHEAEAATFLHTEDLETFGDPLFDLGDELFAGELARGVRIGMIFLGHGHDEFQMHIQTELEHGFGGVNNGRGQRLARRNELHDCGLVRVRSQRYGWGCRGGFEDVCFHEYDCLWFKLRSQRGTEWCRVQPIMASNRRWRWPFRYRGSRRESAGAQLSTLGSLPTSFYERRHQCRYIGRASETEAHFLRDSGFHRLGFHSVLLLRSYSRFFRFMGASHDGDEA